MFNDLQFIYHIYTYQRDARLTPEKNIVLLHCNCIHRLLKENKHITTYLRKRHVNFEKKPRP